MHSSTHRATHGHTPCTVQHTEPHTAAHHAQIATCALKHDTCHALLTMHGTPLSMRHRPCTPHATCVWPEPYTRYVKSAPYTPTMTAPVTVSHKRDVTQG
eukprot:43118-Chlamydomonas_euryale.AAC.1